jgi:hypothetical protein
LKNVIDLARYLLPEPPVPARWRRRNLLLCRGEPTRAICSTMIGQTFQSIKDPILPLAMDAMTDTECMLHHQDVTWMRRHHSLFTPSDFDISPCFSVTKPTLKDGFGFRRLRWKESSTGESGVAFESVQASGIRDA